MFLDFIAVLILLIIILYWVARESYTNKREKAAAVVQWMNNNNEQSQSYTRFRDEVVGGDIVDYSLAKRLDAIGNLSVDTLEQRM